MAKRKTTKKTAGGKAPNPAFAWLMKFMERNPKAVYADAAKAADRAGHKLFPIVWGRAQLLLGRVKAGGGKAKTKVAKRGPGRPAGTRGPGRPPKRGPGRPPRARAAANGTSVVIDDPDAWRGLVEAVNGGATLALSYDGSSWALRVA